MPTDIARVQVLLPMAEAQRLEDYCREHGYKKSTLIARLIRAHLDREGYPAQPNLFQTAPSPEEPRK